MNQRGDISILNDGFLKLLDKFTYLRSSISSTENDINTRLAMAWTALDRLSAIWKSDLSDKIERNFFQEAIVSILLHGCTMWTLSKGMEKKQDNCTRVLRAILNISRKQHLTKQQLYGHESPISKTIQIRRTRHYWKSKNELISNVLEWIPSHERASVGPPARTYLQLSTDTVCTMEDLPKAMDDRDEWRERVREIHASGST